MRTKSNWNVTAIDPAESYTISEVSTRTGITLSTLRHWANTDKLERDIVTGRFVGSDVLRTIKARTLDLKNPDRLRIMRTEYMRSHRARNKVKARARSVITNAIDVGTLIPKPCEVCGIDEVEAHHEDYSKPLSVKWLCKRHHVARHRELGATRRLKYLKHNFNFKT